jgi:hypothetical protein
MKINKLAIAAAAAAITAPAIAGGPGTGIAIFDEMIPVFGPGSLDFSTPGIGDFYADMGMTISSTELLFLGNGVSQGDAGNFDIEGTNGPAFISLFSTSAGGTVTFTFDGPVNLLVDLIVTQQGGTDDVICTVTTMNDGVIVDTEILTLPNPAGDPDGQALFRQWDNADTFHFQLAPNSNRVLAFDFIEWAHLSCGIADINDDGSLNFLDVSAYLAEYGMGCN